MARPGKCADCARNRTLIAKGKCSTCYYRERNKLKNGAKPGRALLTGQRGTVDFEGLLASIRLLIREYHRAVANQDKTEAKFQDLKMKYIVEFHKKWTKKYQQAHAEIQAALKKSTTKEIAAPPPAEEGPQELSFDHK